MSLVFSTNSISSLCLFEKLSDIDTVVVDCSGLDSITLELTVSHSNNVGGTVAGAKFKLTGTSSSGPSTSSTKVSDAKIDASGAASVSGGEVSLSPSSGSTASTLVTVSDPPRWLTIEFAASTFPSTAVGSFASAAASWR